MEVLKDGTFTDSISSETLARCLRSNEKAPRNTKFLIEAVGAVGNDSVLQAIKDLESNRIDTSVFTGSFPFPQLFVFPNFIIVCDVDTIYEYDGTTLDDVIGPVVALLGNLWTVVGVHDFVYLSNGEVAIVRHPTSGIYEVVSDQPIAEALCNYNGQILAGGIYE